MKVIETGFEGLLVFEPSVYADDRGYFFESYNANTWKNNGVEYLFVQDNESKSQYGTIRGLHYQINPNAQTKLVRCTKGKVIDIVVDIRPDQPTYGQSFSIILSNKKKNQLLIPRGFAHGFATLSKTAVFNYKCDNFYNKASERSIHPLDKSLTLDWNIPEDKIILSDKDKESPIFGEHHPF